MGPGADPKPMSSANSRVRAPERYAVIVIGAGLSGMYQLYRLRELGYRIVIFPISTLLAATGAMRSILTEIAAAGTPAAALPRLPTFCEFVDFIGLPEVRAAEQRYAASSPSAAG